MYGELNMNETPRSSDTTVPASRIDQAKHEGIEQLNAQRQKVSANLNQFSSALRQTSQSLSSTENQLAVKAVDWAGQKVDDLASYLSTRDLAMMTSDARQFARQRPKAFLGGLFLAGMGLSRYLRAGAAHMDNQQRL